RAPLTVAIRKVHDFLTVGAPAPLQEAVAVGLETLGPAYYDQLKADYGRRRQVLYAGLVGAGFPCTPPAGAYYIVAGVPGLSDLPDDEFSCWLTKEIGVSPVPGSSFYSRPELGRTFVRFAFCKTEPMLQDAVERLRTVRPNLGEPRGASARNISAASTKRWRSSRKRSSNTPTPACWGPASR